MGIQGIWCGGDPLYSQKRRGINIADLLKLILEDEDSPIRFVAAVQRNGKFLFLFPFFVYLLFFAFSFSGFS